jgi:hypothetical protein
MKLTQYALSAALALGSQLAFAAVSMSVEGLVSFVIYLLVIGIVFGILLFVVGRAPFIPDPWKQIITWIIYLVGAILVINILLGLAGSPMFTLR